MYSCFLSLLLLVFSLTPISPISRCALCLSDFAGFSDGQFLLSVLGTYSTEFEQLQELAMRDELFTRSTSVLTDNAEFGFAFDFTPLLLLPRSVSLGPDRIHEQL